jgi:hypothetical protein
MSDDDVRAGRGLMNTRPGCWEIPSERISMLYWTRGAQPATWRVLWARIVRAAGWGRT